MNQSRVKKIKKFCSEIKTTRKPETQEEWEICKKAHGKEFNDFTVTEFKKIVEALGSNVNITNRDTSLFAFFHNLKVYLSK